MTPARPDVLVIGAGVSGLTTAVCLAERGFAVRVLTGQRPEKTTSAAAGAIWDPIYATHEHVPRWSDQTYQELADLAEPAGGGVAGVRMVDGIEASRRMTPSPAWARQLPGFRECGADDLPPGFRSGWRYTAPIVDMPVYLRYVEGRLTAVGGSVELGWVDSLDAVLDDARVIVNCTGAGARTLVPDPGVTPVRGQLVAARNPGIKEFFAEHTDALEEMTYILPQGDVVLLGGSADEGQTDAADPAVAAGIVQRCIRVVPALADVEILGNRTGIRPSRDRVRVELDDNHGAGRLVHNYGHGGAGVSLSWGCSREIGELVHDLLGGTPAR